MEGLHDFSWALDQLKAGFRVRRIGWGGVSMFVVRMPGYPDGIGANAMTAQALRVPEGSWVKTRPYLAMWDATGMLVPGWIASQTDLLAEDWEVL